MDNEARKIYEELIDTYQLIIKNYEKTEEITDRAMIIKDNMISALQEKGKVQDEYIKYLTDFLHLVGFK